jgi:PKHD-type hydroxylase
MDFQIFPVLEREELGQIAAGVAGGTFVSGKLTAKGRAQAVKHNLQIDRAGPEPNDLDRIVLAALRRNELFQSFAFPKRMVPPIFSRYEPGMEYGSHVDNALMGAGLDTVRSDLAMTIFLSDPASYDGGELVLEMAVGQQEIKLEAGEAVVYSATTVHRVAAVTRGVRLAAVTWVQSAVPDERLRSILFDLSTACRQADADNDAHRVLLLTKCYQNLLRYAIDP